MRLIPRDVSHKFQGVIAERINFHYDSSLEREGEIEIVR